MKYKQLSGVGRFGMATVFGALAAGFVSGTQATGDSLDRLGALQQSWPEAGLELSLEGAAGGAVEVGDAIRYRLDASQGGSCYLLHVDSHGQASLMRPGNCNGDASGMRANFPQGGSLTAGQPLGEERVYAILARDALPGVEQLLEGTPGFASLASPGELEQLVEGIVGASRTEPLAVAALSYQVDSAEEAIQYNTRGIIRKVVEARDDTADGVLASFDVQSVQFDFGSDALTEAGRLQLDAFGAALKSAELEGTRLRVAGHTDDQGPEAYNLDLSERRARAVGLYLEDRFQIDPSRIEVEGFGESQPLVGDTSLEARARNRRVEMVFVE